MNAQLLDHLTLANGVLFDGRELLQDGVVHVRDGVVTHAGARRDGSGGAAGDGEVIDLDGALVAPGFVDIQVNGGGGALFNDTPDVVTLDHITSAHRRYGTTAMFPTFMTGPAEGMRAAAGAVDEARRAGNEIVAGIHFEGPVINPVQAGAHDPSWITDYADEDVLSATLASDAPTIVTLAPECAGPAAIRRLVAAGVKVAGGHTNATFEEMIRAAAAGMSGGTHLWNAMRPMRSRDPGAVGAYLGGNGLWCSLIADGMHVADETIRVSLGCRGSERTLLITDAMPPAAGGPERFRLGPHEVRVENGRCVMAGGVLAGAALEMITAVRHLVQVVGVDLLDALRMASGVPAVAAGLEGEMGSIEAGRTARLVVLDDDLNVIATVVGRSCEIYDQDNREVG